MSFFLSLPIEKNHNKYSSKGPERGILADFWVPHEIESCNFQYWLVFGFPETSQNLISVRQLLFSIFQRGGEGDPEKKSKKPRNLPKLPRPVAKMIWSFFVDSEYEIGEAI